MSGLELAGLVFGVLPIFLQVLQSYRNIHDTLHTFRHYSREVERIRDRFKIQQHNFQNEYSLLQYVLTGEDDLQVMRTNSDDIVRNPSLLEKHLNERLEESCEICKGIVNNTKMKLEEMEEDLKSFAVLKSEKRQHEKLKATIYRVRNSMKVVFDKERYERHLIELRESNMDLYTFRMQLTEILERESGTFRQSRYRKRLPRHYFSVQKVSQTLHKALSIAWKCQSSGHDTHYGKICVEAQVQDMVRLDLALSYKLCQSSNSSNSNNKEDDDHIWVYVQSARIETNFAGLIQQNPVGELSSSDETSAAIHLSQTDAHLSLAFRPVTQPKSPKKRKVSLADGCTLPQSSPYGATEDFNLRNITVIRDFCGHIESIAYSSETCGSGECIGYLETPRLFKHMFYSSERRTFGNSRNKGGRLSQELISLENLLQNTNGETALVDTGSKFKIAHRIATAVLQYHSTPWLREDWRLKDLAYYGNLQEVSNEFLSTLHLTYCFNKSDQDSESTCSRWGSSMSPDLTYSGIDSIYYQYGIENSVLFSLGVALLELAYHQPLERMCGTQEPIAAARKKATSGYPLGQKYQRIVQQCLKCDFGMGSDLTKTKLQTAIYRDVICSLEEMMNCLSLD